MNPLTEWHQILIGKLVLTRVMFLNRFKHFRLSGLEKLWAKLGLINYVKAVDIGKKGKLFYLYVRYLKVV